MWKDGAKIVGESFALRFFVNSLSLSLSLDENEREKEISRGSFLSTEISCSFFSPLRELILFFFFFFFSALPETTRDFSWFKRSVERGNLLDENGQLTSLNL